MRLLGAMVLIGAAAAAVPVSGAERQPAVPATAGVEACGLDGLRLPGTEGCVRFGGSVRTETGLRLGGTAKRDGGGALVRNRAEGRVAADMRVPTDLGPLRLFGSARAWRGN